MTRQIAYYTIPEPGTVNEGHDDFVDALADLRIDWTGDDCGLLVCTGLGNLVIPPGTRVIVRIDDPTLPNSLTVMMPDGSSVIFAAAPHTKPHMGQIMAECDCPTPAECEKSHRCIRPGD